MSDYLNVSQAAFRDAMQRHGAPEETANAIWHDLGADVAISPSSNQPESTELFSHTNATPNLSLGFSNDVTASSALALLGTLIGLAALGLLLGRGWASYGSGFGFLCCIAYQVGFLVAAERLRATNHRQGEGILYLCLGLLTPVTMTAFLDLGGIWGKDPWNSDSIAAWTSSGLFALEAVSLAVATAVFIRSRMAILLLPTIVAAFLFTFSLVKATADSENATPTILLFSSIWFGVTFILAWYLDVKAKKEHGLVLHCFAVVSLVIAGATFSDLLTISVFHTFGFLGLILIGVAIVLKRGGYAVVGGLAVAAWLLYLVFDTLGTSIAAAPVLAVVALGILSGSFYVARKRSELNRWFLASIPPGFLKFIPQNDDINSEKSAPV